MKLAFIGLGTMGAPMARRLMMNGYQVAVYDISETARSKFAGLRDCRVAKSPADAAKSADAVITILPESSDVNAALLGSDGAVKALSPGALVIDMSTGSVEALHSLATSLKEKGVKLIDAPVGRSPKEAETGELLVMVGGEDDNISKVRPVLRCFGADITYAGPLGSGLKLKLVNNYMSMIGMVMTAEALNLAKILGLDQSQTVATLRKTPAGQGQLNTNFPKKVLSGDIAPDFPLRMGLKDINLGLNLAQSAGAASPLGTAAQTIFTKAEFVGRSEQDCTAMLYVLNDLSTPPPTRSDIQLTD